MGKRHKIDYSILNIHNHRSHRIINESDENVLRYFQDIREFKQLTQNEEQELIKKIKNHEGDVEQHKKKLIGSHQSFVIMFAKRHCPNESDQLLDLIQEGNYGLLVALENFDLKNNVKFITYANAWIIKFMFKFLENNELIQRPNRSKTFGVDTKVREKFVRDYGYEPTSQELLEIFNEMGITIKYKEDLDNVIVTSMDATSVIPSDNCDDDEVPTVEYGEEDDIVERINNSVVKENLHQAISSLSGIEATIIKKRFGFDGIEEDISSIANDLGLTVYKVTHILETALSKLKRAKYLYE